MNKGLNEFNPIIKSDPDDELDMMKSEIEID